MVLIYDSFNMNCQRQTLTNFAPMFLRNLYIQSLHLEQTQDYQLFFEYYRKMAASVV